MLVAGRDMSGSLTWRDSRCSIRGTGGNQKHITKYSYSWSL